MARPNLRHWHWLWVVVGAVIILAAVLPIPQWTGAADRGPLWAPYVERWLLGLLIVGTAALLVGRFVSQVPVSSKVRLRMPLTVYLGMLALVVTVASVLVIHLVFASNPHLVDEVAHLFHARVFTAGRLGAPIPEPYAPFMLTHTLIGEPGWVSQYPPGHTLLLALGMVMNAEWLVNPVLGGIGVVLIYWTGRGLYGPKTGLTAATLWAVCPWVVFMSGTYMNHVSGMTLTLACWAFLFGPRRPRAWHGALAGVCMAAAAATRPLDAVAASLAVAVWTILGGRWRSLAWAVAGGIPVILGLLWFNHALFDGVLKFGYTVLYGPEHGLGFHVDPYGEPFTPLIGLSNTVVAIRRLSVYLFEWPVPALLPIAVWGLLGNRRRNDVVLAAALLATPVLYFFYWHSGFHLGPRFYYAAVPALILATARAWHWMSRASRRRHNPHIRWSAALTTAAIVTVFWGIADLVPARIDIYRDGLRSMKLHPERVLADMGVRQALVIVPESWGSRMITRLWALDASAGVVERAYRRLDACDLFLFVEASEANNVRGQRIVDQLEEMIRATQTRIPLVQDSPDPTLRLRPRQLPTSCERELRRDLAGFSLYGSLGWRNAIGLDSGIVFARDLFEANDELFARYPEWPIYRWAPPVNEPNAMPVLTPIRTAEPLQP